MNLIRITLLVISLLHLASCSDRDPYQETVEESLKLNNLEFRELAAHYVMCATAAGASETYSNDGFDDTREFHYHRLWIGMVNAKVCSGSLHDIMRLSCRAANSHTYEKGTKSSLKSKNDELCGGKMDIEVVNEMCPSEKIKTLKKLVFSLTDSPIQMIVAKSRLTNDEEGVLREYYSSNCSYE
jgi:hypothetical protein